MSEDRDDWQWDLVRELACMWEQNPDGVIGAALERAVEARPIIEAYTRTLRFIRLFGVEATSDAPLLELDARPPGVLDSRVVFQDSIWIDIFRRSHRVRRMSAEYAGAVIALLQRRAPDLFVLVDAKGGLDAWLEQTPLMVALRLQLGREQSAERAGGGRDADAVEQ
jgi:hypothetical protein